MLCKLAQKAIALKPLNTCFCQFFKDDFCFCKMSTHLYEHRLTLGHDSGA